MSDRRYTDREVARILQRATELDRDESRPTGRGLTLAQLQEIGSEAGIPADLIARAAGELARPSALTGRTLLGPPPAVRESRSVPTALSREALGAMVRTIDERVPAQGTAVEALGTVRWSAADRFLSRQVTLEPAGDATYIRVEERHEARIPVMLQAIPATWGAMAGLVVATEALGGVAGVVSGVVLVVVAWLLGRMAWEVLARRSAGRVHELADLLAEEAGRLAAGAPREATAPSPHGPEGDSL